MLDQDGERNGRTFLVCFVGLAAYWPLMRRSSYALLFPNEFFYLVFALSAIVAALVVVSVPERARLLGERKGSYVIVVAGMASVLAVLQCFGGFGLSDWVWAAAAIVYGTCFALLSAAWGSLLSRFGIRFVCLLVLASFSFSILLSIACSFTLWASWVAIIVFPLFSTVAARLFRRDKSVRSVGRRADEMGRDDSFSLIGVFVLFLLAGSIVRGFYYGSRGGLSVQSMLQMDVITLLFCLVLALVIAYGGRRAGRPRIFLQAWMILSVLFFVGLVLTLVVSQEERQWGDELTLVARMLLSLFLWMVLLHESMEGRSPVVMMSLWVIAEVSSSLLAYYVVPGALARMPDLAGSPTANMLLTVALFVILLAASFFFLQRVIGDLERNRVIEVVENLQEQRCREIARACGLSARELEIMLLYAQGSSARSIAESLFISPDTVRTHVKNIYDKVGVSKKQELIDMVQAPVR